MRVPWINTPRTRRWTHTRLPAARQASGQHCRRQC